MEEERRNSLSQMRSSLNASVLGLALEKFKQRGNDAASSVAGSISSYRSRRLSASSQVSFTSKRSGKSIRSARGGRGPRRNLKGMENAEPEVIQVFDESGKEVTPKPLVSLRPTVLHERLLQAPPERFSPDSERFSTFSRTGYSISGSLGTLTPEIEGEDGESSESGASASAPRRSSVAPLPDLLTRPPKTARIDIVRTSVAVTPTEQELERTITLTLVESETLVLINLRGNSVSNAYEGIKKVMERNARYKTLLEAKIGSDNYTDSCAQTGLSLQKCKEAQFFAAPRQSEECQANSWDISDCYAGHVTKEEEVDPLKTDDANEGEQADNKKSIAELISAGYLEEVNDTVVQGRRMSGNLPGSRRASGLAGLPTRRESGLLSMDPSRRGSGVGSGTASRRGSTTTSVTPSKRGSISTSRRASLEKGSVSGSIMFNRRLSGRGSLLSSQRRGSSIIPNTMQRPGGEGMLGAEELMQLTMYASRKVDINRLAGIIKALEIVERAVVQNTFHDKLLFYRDFRPREPKLLLKPRRPSSSASPATEAKSSSHSPSNTSGSSSSDVISAEQVHKLWEFQCDLTEGRNVSCMVWNKVSRDLLAVGYGEFEFGKQKGGLIAFWSLKNPRYPHATISTASDVTALDFSSNHPNLLAVGFYDGNVAIYDAKNYRDREPLMQTGTSSGRHNDPVWRLQWIDFSSDHGESLVSVSTDGRVSLWSLKKDLEFVNLMRLKKILTHSKGAQPQPFISRHASGLCFDFSPRDPSLYLVGTEGGLIHKCSRSYNEQYLQTYAGHTGPVFQVRWSTVLPYIFLSCSSDWSVRLWREEQESALLTFQTANESVVDIRWSCKHSCVFGSVSEDGRLEIWDMAISAMKPVIVFPFQNTRLSCLLFSEDAPIVLTGGSTGAVSVFRLVGFDVVESELDELVKLKKAIVSNVNTILD